MNRTRMRESDPFLSVSCCGHKHILTYLPHHQLKKGKGDPSYHPSLLLLECYWDEALALCHHGIKKEKEQRIDSISGEIRTCYHHQTKDNDSSSTYLPDLCISFIRVSLKVLSKVLSGPSNLGGW